MPLSRRTFLAVGAGFLLAPAACGGDDDKVDAAGGANPTDAPTGGSTGNLVIVRFFPDGVLAAGTQRLPIGLGDGDGVLTTGGPDTLTATILDRAGTKVATVEAARHAEALPRPYWPVVTELATPGIYTVRVDTGDGVADAAFTVVAPEEVLIPKPGDSMVPVETPTPDDHRGVDPICTKDPACPLHDLTLTEALAQGTPVAFLVATPAFCQTAACGPVLDVLVGERDAFAGITMVHAEVYTDTTIATTSPAVDAYQLPFEPVLYLAGADGVIRQRLDSIFDAAEVRSALSAL